MCIFDLHIWILVIIMIISGLFGGYLNYLHNFDTTAEQQNNYTKYKYILLGIGSAFLVPAFLKMIASDLIKDSEHYDNLNYLIFLGFCLVAAIFSRRFITTIGDKILETAKRAESISKQAKREVDLTKFDLSTTQERIEDMKVSNNLRDSKINTRKLANDEIPQQLIELVNSFIEKTSIPDYSERLKIKAELGRQMGQIIVRNNLSTENLLEKYPKEGMYLGLAYSVELSPTSEGVLLLKKLSKINLQLYTKYVILIAYRTLANSGFIDRQEAVEINQLIKSFRNKADGPLMRNIDDTINILRFIAPEI